MCAPQAAVLQQPWFLGLNRLMGAARRSPHLGIAPLGGFSMLLTLAALPLSLYSPFLIA